MRTIIVAALGAFGGTLGYAYILNAPKNTILPASFIGLAGYMAYVLLGMAGFGTMSAYFLSTVLVSVVCELLARKMRTPATNFLLSALVPLVPGYNFYLAMLALVENRGAAAAQEGMVAVQIVAAIAIGAAVTSVIFRALAQRGKREALPKGRGLKSANRKILMDSPGSGRNTAARRRIKNKLPFLRFNIFGSGEILWLKVWRSSGASRRRRNTTRGL